MEDNSNAFEWRPFLRQMMVCSTAWSFYFMFGLVLGTPTVTIPQLRNAANSTTEVSDEMASWISSIVGYTGMIWVLILTFSAHRFGLKWTVWIQVINAFTACTVLYFSQNALQVLISQILHGCTAASQTSIMILILTEYTAPRYRGLFLTIKSATLFWGIWAANAIGLYFPYKYIGFVGFLCIIYIFIVLLIMPESPYWLAKKERYDECARAHRWLKGVDNAAEKELEVLITTQKMYKSCKNPEQTLIQYVNSYSSEISKAEMYKPLALCVLLYTMYHMSGKLVFTIYSIDIIKKITNSQSTARIGMLVLDGITVIGMYIGCGLARILKRRTLIISASSLATMFLFIMSAYLFLIRLTVIKENGYVSIAFLMAFSLAIACGPMIMASSIAGELVPVKCRIFCICILAFFTKLILGVVLKIGPYIFKYFGTDGTFLFFAISSTVLILIVYKCLPETKDKTLLEIADCFRKERASESELVSLTRQVPASR